MQPRAARFTVFVVVCVFLIIPALTSAQQTSGAPLIVQPVDETNLTVLKGNTHPLARAQFDQGAAPPSLPMERMLLVLKRSPEQESSLRKLLDDQQDKASPNYHKWLTPDQFGQQFGPADQDIQIITSWLASHGFQVAQVSRGRVVIEFSGTDAQVQEAFHTAIHKFVVNGEEHWANANDPQIPSALTAVVAGVASLNNFRAKPMHHLAGVASREKSSGRIKAVKPLLTLPIGGGNFCGVQSGFCYGVGPYDFATIYGVLPAWTQATPIDGTNQTIAIVGETDINPQDVADFRNFFGLPPYNTSGAPSLKVIHNGPAPGILADGEETESDLDVEWSGAIAKGANIDFVVSESTETTQGIHLSALYIIENDLAPVISESYGFCELALGSSGNQFFSALWQQAAAQGVTVLVSAGDNGAAGCDDFNAQPPAPARFGLQVSGFASTPYNVAVGGSDFNDLTNASLYWSQSNNSTTQASALSYIPETTWDDSCTNPVFGTLLHFSTNAEANCNNSQLIQAGFVNVIGGSGGKSNCQNSDGLNPTSCAGGYPKPSWQTGPNVPQDGVRDIPDVSLFAAIASPSGSFYIVCEADQVTGATSCNPNDQFTEFLGIGGTSASAPAFAGIMALVNQKTGSRQGNPNYVLYKLAAQKPADFHDINSGTIAMPCTTNSPNCNTAMAGDRYGILSGYNAGPGYDLATGLGSVNVSNLLNDWESVSFTPSTTTLNSVSPTSITHGQPVNVSVTVTGNSGTPTGSVYLTGPSNSPLGVDSHNLSNGTASWSTTLLPGGSYSVKANYAGGGGYGASQSANVIPVTVSKENSSTQVNLLTFDFAGHVISNNASTAVYGSPYLLRVNVLSAAGSVCATSSIVGTPQLGSGCPTGNISLTDNGSALDGGTFALNMLGYTEDQLIQLSGGAHNLHAAYSGDSSYNSSSSTDAVTITPATTSVSAPNNSASITVGAIFGASVTVQTQSSGVAPTGTVTFSANGTTLGGTVTYAPTAGSVNGPASLTAQILTSVSAPGTYTITATYGGDGNYGGSTSPGTSATAKYPSPSLTMTASPQSVAAGGSVLLTALVDTSAKGPTPTGPVAFFIANTGVALPGTVTSTPVTDSNGNSALQATLPLAPQVTENIYAQYNGDANYPAAQNFSQTTITVTGNDFNLSTNAPSVTVPSPGATTSGLLLFVGAQSGYSGTINFAPASCTGLPAESSCSFNPASVTGAGFAQLTIATMAPHSAKLRGSSWWTASVGATLAGVFLLGVPSKRRRWSTLLSLVVVAFLVMGLGCGGGGSSGGGNHDPGTPLGTFTVTVTATSGTLTHNASFKLVVQ